MPLRAMLTPPACERAASRSGVGEGARGQTKPRNDDWLFQMLMSIRTPSTSTVRDPGRAGHAGSAVPLSHSL